MGRGLGEVSPVPWQSSPGQRLPGQEGGRGAVALAGCTAAAPGGREPRSCSWSEAPGPAAACRRVLASPCRDSKEPCCATKPLPPGHFCKKQSLLLLFFNVSSLD